MVKHQEIITQDFIKKLDQAPQKKRQLENNNDEEVTHVNKKSKQSNEDDWLELRLSFGYFPMVKQDISAKSKKENDNSQEFDDLDLRLGFLYVPIIPNQQSNNHISKIDTSSLISALGREVSIDCLMRCPRSHYGSVAAINRSFRELVKSGDLYKLRIDSGMVEHWVYISSSLMKWAVFDPYTRKWMDLPNMAADIAFVIGDKESLAVGTELLYLGRDMTGQAIYKYNLITNSWSSGTIMNTPRCLFGSASIGRIGIFAGGCDSSGKVSNVVEKYNGDSGTWETLPSMIKPRRMSSGVFMDGKFYVIGGTGPDDKHWPCGEEFDLETNKWTEVPNLAPVHQMPSTSAPPLVAVVENELYAADWAERALKKYDKNRREWEAIGTLPERASNMHGWGIAFRGCGNRLIVVGGPRECGGGNVEIYSWVPSQGPPEWTIIGRKRSHSFVYNCAIMGC